MSEPRNPHNVHNDVTTMAREFSLTASEAARLVAHFESDINACVKVERDRWARLVVAFGYPFDFTNSEAVPDHDMLDAIAEAWVAHEAGPAAHGGPMALAETRWGMAIELGDTVAGWDPGPDPYEPGKSS